MDKVNIKPFDDIPPTQPLGDIDPSLDEDDYMSGDSDETPQDPDLAWYLSQWDMSDLQRIGLCRTYANYLSARIPKNVEAKPARYSGKKLKK